MHVAGRIPRIVSAAATTTALAFIVASCSSGSTPEAPSSGLPSSGVSSPTPTPSRTVSPSRSAAPSKVVIPKRKRGEVARLEYRGKKVSTKAFAKTKAGTSYAAHVACASSDPSVTFSFVIRVSGNEVSAATIPCDGSRYVNTILKAEGPHGRVEIIPGRDNQYQKMTAAYLVVAPL